MIRSVAVIGAGAAGLISSLVLLQNGFQVTVYEQSNDVGGVWNYSPGSSAMYESLRTNLPKEIMAFNQQNPFDASSSSFPTHYEVQAYLRSLVDTYRIRHLIKFRHKVVNISKIATDHCDQSSLTTNRDHWILQWEAVPNNDVNGGTGTDFFDAVLVCNGHFSVPFLPKMPTLGYFKGISIHSNQYDQVKHSLWDKRVLIVGTKSSGTDIARELLSIAAAVHISDRNYVLDIIDSATQGTEALSSKVLMHPAIGEIDAESSAVIFADGSKVCDLDAIIWCTGYVYDFPFLADKRSGVKSSLTDSCAEGTIDQSLIVPVPSAGDIPTAVQVEEGKRVRPLYQQLFAIEDHSLVFVGLPFKVVPFPLFYLQGKDTASIVVTWARRGAVCEYVVCSLILYNFMNGMSSHNINIFLPVFYFSGVCGSRFYRKSPAARCIWEICMARQFRGAANAR